MTTTSTAPGTPDRPGALNWAMISILGFVWGGLGFILFTAIRRERAKST